MQPLSLKTSIDVSRERVFDEINDLSRRSAWTDHFISDLRLERIDASGRGAAARFRVDAPGGNDFMETVIDEAEPPHTLSERGRGGRWDRVPIRTSWELSGGQGSPTELTLTFSTEPAHPLDRMRGLRAGGWWKRRWRKALQRLRDQLESSAPPPEPVGVGGGDRRPTGMP
ncbi:MAG: SRPBCC family protein [Actinomycetota bacterium]|nr:SRPBCC family protein [Actinomycetota bacterium]